LINECLHDRQQQRPGLGLTESLMARDAIVWGMSRRGCPLKPKYDDVLRDRIQDLGQLNTIEEG
jgi:benzil reductase ((S)-benzoin forming)